MLPQPDDTARYADARANPATAAADHAEDEYCVAAHASSVTTAASAGIDMIVSTRSSQIARSLRSVSLTRRHGPSY